MAEISGIQLLVCVIILVLFYLVFNIVQTNWTNKSFSEEEEVVSGEISVSIGEKVREAVPVMPFAKTTEIRLVPLVSMEKAKEEPQEKSPRELVLAGNEQEELYSLSKAQ